MAQKLRMRSNKNGNSKGVAIRKTNSSKSSSIKNTLFSLAYKKSKNNGTSKNKTS